MDARHGVTEDNRDHGAAQRKMLAGRLDMQAMAVEVESACGRHIGTLQSQMTGQRWRTMMKNVTGEGGIGALDLLFTFATQSLRELTKRMETGGLKGPLCGKVWARV